MKKYHLLAREEQKRVLNHDAQKSRYVTDGFDIESHAKFCLFGLLCNVKKCLDSEIPVRRQ